MNLDTLKQSVPSIDEIKVFLESFIRDFDIKEDYHVVLIGFGVLVAFFLLIRVLRRKKKKHVEIIEEIEEIEDVEPQADDSVNIDEDAIVAFFLKIYKAQIGASTAAKSKTRLLKSGTDGSPRTFELSVQNKNEWTPRRMSISPLGVDSGSRSKCYYVIYDEHLVLKIPPRPINDFDAYMGALLADHRIVERLVPRECIVPTVSAILKLVYPLSKSRDLSPVEVEERYQGVIQRYTKFKDYFKIQNTYIFAMDLSRYFFLSQIINDIHKLEEKLHHDITGYPDVIWENHGFEGRYGFENDAVVDAIKDVFRDVEKQLKAHFSKLGLEKPIGGYQMRQWFLNHLAGREIGEKQKELSAEKLAEVNKLLKRLLKRHAEAVETYLDTIRGCIQSVTVQQNKPALSGLVTNILDLLTWLREKQVAARDLKPDNLLVAGDQNQYPEFLEAASDYSVGLIDVETAAVYSDGELSQPILGGTPSYATPSHLYANDALSAFFGDCRRLLYTQDWYAAIGMIYEVITGERLFNQTGKLIIGIKNMTMNPDEPHDAQFELFVKTSRMFWHSAQNELNRKIALKESLLSLVQVHIPDQTRDMLCKHLLEERKIIAERIKTCMANQSVVKGEKNRQALMNAPRQKLAQLKAKYIKQVRAGQSDKKTLIQVLQRLENLKKSSETNLRLGKLFSRQKLTLPVDKLLQQLFSIVQESMYRWEWGEPEAASVLGVDDRKETTTVESTV